MSMNKEQLNTILDFQADMDMAIAEGDWKKAYEVIFAVKDYGYEHEAKIMLDSLVRKQKEYLEHEEVTFEPVEDSIPPVITPEEDDAPVRTFHKDWVQEGDKKFPV